MSSFGYTPCANWRIGVVRLLFVPFAAWQLAPGAGGQQFGPGQFLTASAGGPRSAFAVDLDGDGDEDILGAFQYDDKIAWSENTDGLGTFALQQTITAEARGASGVFAADLDGDGDQDVLSSSGDDDKIAWYEHTDGLGTFGDTRVITSQADSASSVHAADLDGDGDLDALSTAWSGGEVAWYENQDGQGTFGPQKLLNAAAIGAEAVFAADLDGDGDQDVLSASSVDGGLEWYENQDGLGTFGVEQLIASLAGGATSVSVGDPDGDGDPDVLSSSYGDGQIAWHENTDGLGSFGPEQVVTTAAPGAGWADSADLDGDGDPDVISASHDSIAWYENTGGPGAFGPQQVITSSVVAARSVLATDADGDGDQDVFSASLFDHKLAMYENVDGLGSFGPQVVITITAHGARSVFAADLDGDGDQDVLSGSELDDLVAWYENTDGLGSTGPQQAITTGAAGVASAGAPSNIAGPEAWALSTALIASNCFGRSFSNFAVSVSSTRL